MSVIKLHSGGITVYLAESLLVENSKVPLDFGGSIRIILPLVSFDPGASPGISADLKQILKYFNDKWVICPQTIEVSECRRI